MNTTPTSLADLMAQFSTAAPRSSPDAATSAPMPAPMAPMAPAAPPSGNSGGNFGAQMQKALPMLMALMARKQGGPLAGASMLEGYARGQMQRKQAEDEALALELQTIQNEDVKAARKSDHERKRLMERESWVRTLQEDLTKINDPEQFAAVVDRAAKYGAPLHGLTADDLKSTFKFPDARVGEAAKAKAGARLEALRKVHGENFDALVRQNAIDKDSGKTLQDLQATAGLQVIDAAGAPILPQPKDDFQIPNSDAGFDFRIELAAEEDRLGRKLKPGERSALRNRLKAQQEATLRGRRRSGTGGGSGSGTGGDGSLVDTVIANPDLWQTLTPTVQGKIAPALHRRGFKQWGKVAPKKPPTGMERKVAAYYERMEQSTGDLERLEDGIAKSGSMSQFWMSNAPNMTLSTDQQAYNQAQRAFTEARLRKDSGAAIPNSEYANDARIYFVQPGDSQEVIEQKRLARNRVMQSTAREAGPALDEFFGEDEAAMRRERPATGPKEGDRKPIPGVPGGEAEYRGGKWVRVK